MQKGRLEAFSDGVFAIIITIMVLQLEPPEVPDFRAIIPLVPTFMSYLLSFVYVGIYWNNHHHMLQLTGKVNGAVLWANMHLLFWLSLIPFVTGWLGNTGFASEPLIVYGILLFLAAVAYYLLQKAIIKVNGTESLLAKALGKSWKEQVSPVLYLIGIITAFFIPLVSAGFYVLVALLWLIPDKRIEKSFHNHSEL